MASFTDLTNDIWLIIAEYCILSLGMRIKLCLIFPERHYLFSKPKSKKTSYTTNVDICVTCGLTCILWNFKNPWTIPLPKCNSIKVIESNTVECPWSNRSFSKIRLSKGNTFNVDKNGIIIKSPKDNKYCSQWCAKIHYEIFMKKNIKEYTIQYHINQIQILKKYVILKILLRSDALDKLYQNKHGYFSRKSNDIENIIRLNLTQSFSPVFNKINSLNERMLSIAKYTNIDTIRINQIEELESVINNFV